MEEKSSAKRFFESTGLLIIGFLSMMYFTLLGKALWDWFLVDRFFELTYWELFLGVVVVRFILLGSRLGSIETRMDNQVGKLQFLEQTMRTVGNAIGGTMIFGILFIINLIISYYS